MSSNGRLDCLKSVILDILASRGKNESLKRKKITSKCIAEGQIKDLNKSEVKKALRELVKSGRVKDRGEDGSSRYMICSYSDSELGGGSDSGSSSSDWGAQDEPLPFAQLMRERAEESSKGDDKKTSGEDDNGSEEEGGGGGGGGGGEDIDDEIRRLEAELAAHSDGDASSDYSGGSYDESIPEDDEMEGKSKRKILFGASTEYADDRRMATPDEHTTSGARIIRSNLEAERIAPLPKSALPQMKRRKLKGIDADAGDDGNPGEQKKKRTSSDKDEKEVSDGLREAVKEVLSGYTARSHERIPFYCRVCSVQSKDMVSFLAHKNTDFHKAAVRAERKATYCHACRKQFTSPVQMEDHLNSKPHNERMVFLRSRHQRGGDRGGRGGRGPGRTGGSGNFGGGGGGYCGRGRGDSRARSNRQWC